MCPERLERVQVNTARHTLELPWASRDELLDYLRRFEAGRPIVAAFEAVGASRPVRFTLEQKRDVVIFVDGWMQEVGVTSLPEGVFELRNELLDDLHDADQRATSS